MDFGRSLKIFFGLLIFVVLALVIVLANNYSTLSKFKAISFKGSHLNPGFNLQNGPILSPSITGKVTSVSREDTTTILSLEYPIHDQIFDRIKTVDISLSGDYASVAEILEEKPSEVLYTIKNVDELTSIFDSTPYVSVTYPTANSGDSSLEYLLSSPDLPINLHIYKYILEN